MPVKSGASHALAGIIVLLTGPLVREMWLEIVNGHDVMVAIEAASNVVAEHPYIPAGNEIVGIVLTISTLVVLIYIWGHAYHVKRHGSS